MILSKSPQVQEVWTRSYYVQMEELKEEKLGDGRWREAGRARSRARAES